MSTCDTEKLFLDDKFIKKQIRNTPYYLRSQLTKDELLSDLYLAISTCIPRFNIKFGDGFQYVRKAYINNLNKTLRDKSFFNDIEAPLELAYNMSYHPEDPEEAELVSYISSLPDLLLQELTEFALGQKNKEEIISNPSFQKINVDRVIDKLDALV